MKIFSAFPTPIYINNIDYDFSLLETIKSYEYEIFHTKEQSGTYTISKKILERQELSSLKTIIENMYKQYMYEVLGFSDEIDFRITTSWVVRLFPNDYGQKHFHTNSFFSGVLYLDVDEQTSPIIFYKNGSNINELGNPSIIEIPFTDGFRYNEFNSHKWTYYPKKNDLIIFPSYLNHEMTENKSTITR
jgi:uncharacterized protein (TIGR02466 family)